MKLAVSIQHHPSRIALLPPLLAALAPLDVRTVEDPSPDSRPAAWRTYRRALEEAPADATNLLVIQDDAEPCRSFAACVELAVAAEPDRLLVLCVCGQPRELAREIERARSRRLNWAELRAPRWIPAIALVWPAALIPRALDWIDQQRWPHDFVADDEILMRTMVGLGEVALATVPSLVQHPDEAVSIVKRHRHRAGANLGRVAACFDPDPDPLALRF